MLRKLGIEPGEARVFAWGASALFLVGWADVSMKNVAEALFVKRIGVELMPLAFLASSALLVLTTSLVGGLAARHDRLRLLPRVFIGLGLSLVPLWLLVRLGLESGFGLLLIASKQITSVALLVFWIALGDLLHSRQTKRLFAPMMAGVTLGIVLGSFASKPLADWLGIAGLLPAAAVAMLLGGAAASRLAGQRPHLDPLQPVIPSHPHIDRDVEEPTDSIFSLWREHALFRILSITTLCSGLLGPMLYFQFQYVADLATIGQGGEQRLLALYAQFRGWIYGAVLVIQLVGSGRLFRRIGLPLAATLSPLTYLAGFLGLSVHLSLPAGVAAMAGTKIQDEAIYDPALRVLYSLFPDSIRARATALLEGPVKRGGGGIGNAAIVAALALGSPPWVGYLAIPLALAWVLVSLVLWGRYPRLLLGAAAARSEQRDTLGNELLDPATARALIPEICGTDSSRAWLALELVGAADTNVAARALAEAARKAPPANRPWIVTELDHRLERALAEPLDCPDAARQLSELLRDDGTGLGESERADLVRAYARLQPGTPALAVLERVLGDSSPAVRLAARAALEHRGAWPGTDSDLDQALAGALRDDAPAARRTARKELHALLLPPTPGGRWAERLDMLAGAFADGIDRAETAIVLADIAQRHRERVAKSSKKVLTAREDPDPRVRAALLRWAGYAGQQDQLEWLIENLTGEDPECAAAAREGVSALGSISSTLLLRELSYGKRSKRDAVIEVMHELDLRPGELGDLYHIELDSVERDLGSLVALHDRPALALLRQRLSERVHETLHTALLLLAAIRKEGRIAGLGERLKEMTQLPRQRAIVIEALESLLPPSDRKDLLPLLEAIDSVDAGHDGRLSRAVGLEQTLRDLIEDPEELTRTIARGLLAAAERPTEEHGAVNVVEIMAHLKKVSLFEDLTARQLMELARAAKEDRVVPDTVVVQQGEYDDHFYLVIEGVIHIRRGDTLLTEIGPGQFFGEIALLEGGPRSADAITKTRVRLLRLERGELMKRIDENPEIAVGMLRHLARRVRELTDRVIV